MSHLAVEFPRGINASRHVLRSLLHARPVSRGRRDDQDSWLSWGKAGVGRPMEHLQPGKVWVTKVSDTPRPHGLEQGQEAAPRPSCWLALDRHVTTPQASYTPGPSNVISPKTLPRWSRAFPFLPISVASCPRWRNRRGRGYLLHVTDEETEAQKVTTVVSG